MKKLLVLLITILLFVSAFGFHRPNRNGPTRTLFHRPNRNGPTRTLFHRPNRNGPTRSLRYIEDDVDTLEEEEMLSISCENELKKRGYSHDTAFFCQIFNGDVEAAIRQYDETCKAQWSYCRWA
jgi:hypothetical protein